MSQNRHPNFNASKFSLDVAVSFFECMKTEIAQVLARQAFQVIQDQIIEIVEKAENTIDNMVDGNTKAEESLDSLKVDETSDKIPKEENLPF